MGEMDMGLEAVLELGASTVAHRPRADRDLDLLEALRLHDPTAAERLVATYGERAYRLATSITGNEQDAEEVVQDAFWTVVRKIDSFRGEAAFGSWLYRIVANAAYQKRRGCQSRQHDVSIDELPAAYRAVLVLRDVEGRSTVEIAEMLGLSIAVVKTRAHRARLFLRK